MKVALTFIAATFFAVALGIASNGKTQQIDQRIPSDKDSGLKGSLISLKPSYILGELVQVFVRLENTGVADEAFWRDGGTRANAHFYVAQNDKFVSYERYRFTVPSFHRRLRLRPGEANEVAGTILWNHKSKIGHLSDYAISNIARREIMTDHAFPSAGRYLVRADVFLTNRPKIEAAPIEIIIREPEGLDAEVWKLIDKNPDISLFVQEAAFNPPRGTVTLAEYRERLLREMEEIVRRYPTGILSRQIAERLRIYNTKPKNP